MLNHKTGSTAQAWGAQAVSQDSTRPQFQQIKLALDVHAASIVLEKIWARRKPVLELGTITFAGDGNGVYTAHPINTLPDAGANLAIAVESGESASQRPRCGRSWLRSAISRGRPFGTAPFSRTSNPRFVFTFSTRRHDDAVLIHQAQISLLRRFAGRKRFSELNS